MFPSTLFRGIMYNAVDPALHAEPTHHRDLSLARQVSSEHTSTWESPRLSVGYKISDVLGV